MKIRTHVSRQKLHKSHLSIPWNTRCRYRSMTTSDNHNIKKGKTRPRLDSPAKVIPVASKRCLFVPGYKVLLPRGPRQLGATAVIDFFFLQNKFWREIQWRHLGWIRWPHAMQSGLTGSRTKDALLSMSYREKRVWCREFILRRHSSMLEQSSMHSFSISQSAMSAFWVIKKHVLRPAKAIEIY